MNGLDETVGDTEGIGWGRKGNDCGRPELFFPAQHVCLTR